jgi:hypothetical protein
MTAAVSARAALEVADVIRHYGETFLDKYGGVLSHSQRQALRDLVRCRTAELGGHVEHCLDADEFLRRFVQHVLPKSFVKIRHYGLLANAQREARLAACRRLLLVTAMSPAAPREDAATVEHVQPRCCPNCGGIRLVYREIEAADKLRLAAQDSS